MKTLSERRTVRDWLSEAFGILEGAGLSTARLDAEWLLAHVLGVERRALYLEPERRVPAEAGERFLRLLSRRGRGEPLQHLLGWEEFCGLRLRVSSRVLIPRQETELLVEWALAILRRAEGSALRVLDLGTGSGAIACALAQALSHLMVVAIDISAEALAVAAENIRALGLERRVRLLQGDLCGPLAHPRGTGAQVGGAPALRARVPARAVADLLIANLPYIPSGPLGTLPAEVRHYEPRLALDGGPDGMAFHRRILAEAPDYLRPRAWLLMEVGEGQAEPLARMLAQHEAFEAVEVRRDLAGVDRMIGAERR